MHGHAATTAPNSFGVAATPAATAFQSTPAHVGPYPGTFSGSNTIESFSSDGPRRIFFTGNGSPLTPGNFSSTGGQVLQKPDFTAADGVSISGAGGFSSPFYGTSAAAPHAAAIAALVKSRNLAQTASQVRAALFSSAIDIEGLGVDRDSGVGIIMADTAVAAVNAGGGPTITAQPANQSVTVGSSASFTVAASGNPAPTVQWQVSTNAGSAFFNLANSAPYSGVTTATLTISSSPLSFNGTRYRAVATNSAGSATSNAATLIVRSVVVDADGDGRSDLAIFRPSTGTWFARYSAQGYGTATAAAFQWGLPGDIPISGDFDGDGKIESTAPPVGWRPSGQGSCSSVVCENQ
jgi:subtilisin family serine protease